MQRHKDTTIHELIRQTQLHGYTTDAWKELGEIIGQDYRLYQFALSRMRRRRNGRATRNEDDSIARDVIQDIVVNLPLVLRRFVVGKYHLWTYLKIRISWRISDQYRELYDKSPISLSESYELCIPDCHDAIQDVADRDELRHHKAVFLRYVAELPSNTYRKVLIWLMMGHSVREIAKKLFPDEPFTPTVRNRVYKIVSRAKEQLRKLLEVDGHIL